MFSYKTEAKKKKQKTILFFSLAIFSLILIFFACLFTGQQKFSFQQILKAFYDKNSFEHTIIFSIRLPRLFLNIFAGALLAGSGAVFQNFFQNPLAESGILGLSASATFGAVVSKFILTSLGFSSAFIFSSLNISAFFSALIAGFLLCTVSAFSKSKTAIILLFGIALGNFCSAFSSVIILSKSKDFSGIYSWILGSFSGRGWKELKFILIPGISSVIMMIFLSSPLDLMITGEKSAKTLGLNVQIFKILILFSVSMSTSCAVCAGGTINFVGIIAPHLLRIFSKKLSFSSKFLVPASMISGAALVILTDTVARTIFSPQEIPAGIIMSFLGAPFFVSLILKKGSFKS